MLKGLDLAMALRSSPEFAHSVRAQIDREEALRQGQQLAQASYGIDDFIANKMRQHKQTWDASQPVPQVPFRPQEYQAPTALQRWRWRNDAMMATGMPKYQDQALENTAKISEFGAGAQSNPGKIAMDAGFVPGTKPYNDFVQRYAFKQSQLYENSLDKPLLTSDYEKWMMPDGSDLPAGTTWRQLQEMGGVRRGEKTSGDAGRLAGLQTSMAMFPLLDAIILPTEGKMNERVLDGAFYYSLDPIEGKPIANAIMNNKYSGYSPEELSMIKQVAQVFDMSFQSLVRTESGAEVPPSEQKNAKARFQPGPGDPPAVKKQKYLALKYFFQNSVNMMDKSVMKNGTPEQLTAELNKAISESLAKFKVGGAPGTKASVVEDVKDAAGKVKDKVEEYTEDLGDYSF